MSRQHTAGFSRIELIVTVAVVAFLAAWLIFNHTGERGRMARCAGNFKILSHAIHAEAHDHHNQLVPAGIKVENTQRSWDTSLLPYLNPSPAKSASGDASEQLDAATAARFHCPSDTFERGANPRTYAMAAREMAVGWPPGRNDKTGLGAFWEHGTIVPALGEAAWESLRGNPETLPRLDLSVVSAPAHTLMLSELLTANNTVGQAISTRVFGADHQVRALRIAAIYGDGPQQYHKGRFNYLMVDGHVECLTVAEAGGRGGAPAGIWTIEPND